MSPVSARPGWASEVAFDALGVTCVVRSTDLEFGAIVAELTGALSPSLSAPDVMFFVIQDGDRYQLFDREQVKVWSGPRSEVLMRLLRLLNSAIVERKRTQR